MGSGILRKVLLSLSGRRHTWRGGREALVFAETMTHPRMMVNYRVRLPPADPGAFVSRSKRLAGSLQMPASLLRLADANRCGLANTSLRSVMRSRAFNLVRGANQCSAQKTVAYSRKCQTSTATPAKPGDLPLGLALTNRCFPSAALLSQGHRAEPSSAAAFRPSA